MFGLFDAVETHPEAKTIGQYYKDLNDAAKRIRVQVVNVDSDAAFLKAADVIEELYDLCKDIESVPALRARDINTERSTLLRGIGSAGIIDVEGEASKLLAIKYNELLQEMIEKKYWPAATCPSLLGRSFLTEYAKSFEERKPRLQRTIALLEGRINDYDNYSRARLAS